MTDSESQWGSSEVDSEPFDTMLQILLIRPGATEYDRDHRIQGNLNVPLSDEGREEVRQMGHAFRNQGLSLRCLYVASSEPSQETAKLLIESGLDCRKLKAVEAFQNLDQGLWQGMLIEDIRRSQPKIYRMYQDSPECICPPEGEMFGEAEDRVLPALEKLIRRHRDGMVGIVVSAPIADMIRKFIGHGEVHDLWKTLEEHGRWELLEVGSGKESLLV